MNVAIVIATYGDAEWNDRACRRACLSAKDEAERAGCEVVRLHDPDGTLAGVRNAAAATTEADWLCFLDADDELEPGYLAAMNPGGAWGSLLVPAVRYIRHGRFSTAALPQRGRWPELNECVIGTLVPRRLFEAVGGFREETADGTPLVSLEDYDLWLRCYDAGARLVYVEEAVYRAYVNPVGRNRDQSPYAAIWADHLARIAA